jgi:hypothetical protein
MLWPCLEEHRATASTQVQATGLLNEVQRHLARVQSEATNVRQAWPLTPTRYHVLRSRSLVMGILNATPDSFSDGGRYLDRCARYHATSVPLLEKRTCLAASC